MFSGMRTSALQLAAATAILLAHDATALAQTTIAGAGATFPYPIYSRWAEAYREETGNSLNYQSIGSGGGLAQIQARTVDFGASDMPLEPELLEQRGLVQFPAIIGGVVPVLNLEGIEEGELRLTGPVLADIYRGEITRWDDEQIAELNPDLELPDQSIAVVHRADGSGTTFLFTDYLSKVSEEWQSEVGSSTQVRWPTGVGGQGNAGVAAMVQQTSGGIGYVEFAYAEENDLPYAQLRNRAEQFVSPSIETFQAAAADAEWGEAEDFYVILTNQGGQNDWPITGASFILVPQQTQNPENTRAALSYFDWAFQNGDELARELDYVPVPASLADTIREYWREEIVGPDGQPVWTGESTAGNGAAQPGMAAQPEGSAQGSGSTR